MCNQHQLFTDFDNFLTTLLEIMFVGVFLIWKTITFILALQNRQAKVQIYLKPILYIS